MSGATVTALPVGRCLPHDLAAEKYAVGCCIVAGARALAELAGILDPRDFYAPHHAEIFAAMLALDAAHKPVDHLTTEQAMRESDKFYALNAHGGALYFAECSACVVSLDALPHQARRIRALSEARLVAERAQEVASKGAGDLDPEAYLDEAERILLEAFAHRAGEGPRSVAVGLRGVVSAIERRREAPGGVVGIPSGYGALDALLTGFKPGEFYVVAARPKMGKTALLGCIALDAALSATRSVPVLIFSLEMGLDALTERMIVQRGNLDAQRLRIGRSSQADYIRMMRAASEISEAPIWIDDEGGLTLTQLCSRARRWRMRHAPTGEALIVVDYLQLVTHQSKGRDQNREREVAQISQGLKAISKQINAPVIALSQLNRDLEKRADKRPQPSDLRESGAIEQDADAVIMLYRDEVYNADTKDPGICEVSVPMQRSGPTGTVRLRWVAASTRFETVPAE